MKKIFILFILVLSCSSVFSQELDCKISINHQQIQGTNVQVFKTLENSLMEFINNRKWTSAQYEMNERIRCSFNLTVKSYDEAEGRWECDMVIQATRPVYQSGYQSATFSFKDPDVNFNYREFDPLELRENQIDNNLLAVLAYYAYMIIGIDMDSMSPKGGTEMIVSAQNIVNASQMLNERGWKAFDDSRNRYALAYDYLDEGMSPMRQLIYEYHRKGLDEMSTNANRGRASITQAIALLKSARDNKPMSSLPVIFSEIKKDELINIYGLTSPSSQSERDEIFNIMSNINPSLNTDWNKIKSKQ